MGKMRYLYDVIFLFFQFLEIELTDGMQHLMTDLKCGILLLGITLVSNLATRVTKATKATKSLGSLNFKCKINR